MLKSINLFGSVYLKISRRGHMAALPQKEFLATYPRGCVAAWLQPLIKPVTPIVGSLLFMTYKTAIQLYKLYNTL